MEKGKLFASNFFLFPALKPGYHIPSSAAIQHSCSPVLLLCSRSPSHIPGGCHFGLVRRSASARRSCHSILCLGRARNMKSIRDAKSCQSKSARETFFSAPSRSLSRRKFTFPWGGECGGRGGLCFCMSARLKAN